MANRNDSRAVLRQNLQDAGCDEQMTEYCMRMAERDAAMQMLPLLKRYRSRLLDGIHEQQDRLECLDYLIYNLNKQQSL